MTAAMAPDTTGALPEVPLKSTRVLSVQATTNPPLVSFSHAMLGSDCTANWLLPAIGGLLTLLGGLYSLYLLYLGLPTLMRSAPDRTGVYFLAILAATVVLAILVGALTSCMGNFGGPISL